MAEDGEAGDEGRKSEDLLLEELVRDSAIADVYVESVKELINSLTNPVDKETCLVWLEFIKAHKEEIPILFDYLILLLFSLHQDVRAVPFDDLPPPVEDFNEIKSVDLFSMGQKIIEANRDHQEKKDRIKKATRDTEEARSTCGAAAETLPIFEYNSSGDTKELFVSQKMPGFGRQCYFTISNKDLPFYYPPKGDAKDYLARVAEYLSYLEAAENKITECSKISQSVVTKGWIQRARELAAKDAETKSTGFSWFPMSVLPYVRTRMDLKEIENAYKTTESRGKEIFALDERTDALNDRTLVEKDKLAYASEFKKIFGKKTHGTQSSHKAKSDELEELRRDKEYNISWAELPENTRQETLNTSSRSEEIQRSGGRRSPSPDRSRQDASSEGYLGGDESSRGGNRSTPSPCTAPGGRSQQNADDTFNTTATSGRSYQEDTSGYPTPDSYYESWSPQPLASSSFRESFGGTEETPMPFGDIDAVSDIFEEYDYDSSGDPSKGLLDGTYAVLADEDEGGNRQQNETFDVANRSYDRSNRTGDISGTGVNRTNRTSGTCPYRTCDRSNRTCDRSGTGANRTYDRESSLGVNRLFNTPEQSRTCDRQSSFGLSNLYSTPTKGQSCPRKFENLPAGSYSKRRSFEKSPCRLATRRTTTCEYGGTSHLHLMRPPDPNADISGGSSSGSPLDFGQEPGPSRRRQDSLGFGGGGPTEEELMDLYLKPTADFSFDEEEQAQIQFGNDDVDENWVAPPEIETDRRCPGVLPGLGGPGGPRASQAGPIFWPDTAHIHDINTNFPQDEPPFLFLDEGQQRQDFEECMAEDDQGGRWRDLTEMAEELGPHHFL